MWNGETYSLQQLQRSELQNWHGQKNVSSWEKQWMVFWEGGSDISEESPAHGGAAVTDAAILTSRLVAALQHRRPTVRVFGYGGSFQTRAEPDDGS